MESADRRRVVVTGIGMVSPLGATAAETWDAVCAGRSGIGTITRFDPSALDVRIAGEVKGFDPLVYMDRKEVRRADRFVQFAIAATAQALTDARLEITADLAPRVGVVYGTGVGGVSTIVENVIAHDRDPRKVSPFMIPMMILDMAAGEIAMKFGAKGPNLATASACASSAHAVGQAADTIRRGQADVMVAGGSEAGLIPVAIGAFSAMHALSRRNDDPQRASRPFDKDRDGFVFSEGGATLILEELEFARARGATIVGELAGFGSTADAHHITSPSPGGSGAVRAMRMAIDDAGIAPEQVTYVNAHGTSTPPNDREETAALKALFGDHAARIAVSSTKSMTGHLLGAAGAIEAAFCVLAMRDAILPPTINYTTPDPECDLDYVPNTARPAEVEYSLSNSMGFGGHNAALVLRRWNGSGR